MRVQFFAQGNNWSLWGGVQTHSRQAIHWLQVKMSSAYKAGTFADQTQVASLLILVLYPMVVNWRAVHKYSCFFLFCFFSVRHLSVLRGHSIFPSPPQWALKDFYTRSYQLHYFLLLILEKEPVFPFSMLSAKQVNYWYHFYNVFGMTGGLNPGPPALESTLINIYIYTRYNYITHATISVVKSAVCCRLVKLKQCKSKHRPFPKVNRKLYMMTKIKPEMMAFLTCSD